MKYILTTAGERYLSRVNAQMMGMSIRRVEVGQGTVSADALKDMTALVNKKQQIQVESIEQDTNEAVIHCVLTNLEIHEEYVLQQSAVIAYDSVDDAEYLIFAGQDERGERIPPVEERMVEYLHNIAIKVKSTQQITFDVSLGDFVRKDYLQEQLDKMGRVLVGPADTQIGPNDVLLIVHEAEAPTDTPFDAASFSNMQMSSNAPAKEPNWGRPRIVDGRLVVADKPQAGAKFWAREG